jgi:hypothetical protein
MLTVLIPVAVIALIVIIGVIAFQRGQGAIDLSPQAMLRSYLYVGSFAGVIALAFGLSALLNGALASVVGSQIVYGGTPFPPIPAIARPCPVGATCPPEPNIAEITERQRQENDRRRQEDLLRGATFTVFGALFYGAHRTARRSIYPRNVTVGTHGDGLQRAYHLLGTVVFGIGAIALLPAGLYQVLANSLLTLPGDFFRQGVADTLAGGVVSTVLWLLYLRAVLADTSGGDPPRYYRTGPSGPPAEPAPVGARIGPGPGERSAGAEAQPPRDSAFSGWRPRGAERLREIERERTRRPERG